MTAIKPVENHRILAIDVRPQKVGYAVFENSARLLDAGTRKMKSSVLATARTAALINESKPSVLLLRRILRGSARNRPRTRMLQGLITRLAAGSHVEVAFVSETELREYFRAQGLRTKYEIAILLAKEFPDLAWKLHEERKIYDGEPWSMVVFDAAALGVAYLARA